ncbi:MAG: GIY-YIG nuclease family protein [Phenylobacterium sp.]|nr:GIY-YIG nuclease family protein [Phenylobacterium sp.]MDP1616986.1 GIY-YIG nuclease family protein [Phenylobacterium sp.]MDP1986175.1 GIY-YIG nuclease family protein [Phenylobacterium sp.]MDP3385527.1 GIY-YIG nuclease family protein [Phenylobacterium sp.]
MLKCADGSYYVGSHRGGDVQTRVGQHQAGEGGVYTQRRRPVVLVWCEEFQRITDAIAFERQIKGWSRAKKEALVEGDWANVSALARRRNPARSCPRPAPVTPERPSPEKRP